LDSSGDAAFLRTLFLLEDDKKAAHPRPVDSLLRGDPFHDLVAALVSMENGSNEAETSLIQILDRQPSLITSLTSAGSAVFRGGTMRSSSSKVALSWIAAKLGATFEMRLTTGAYQSLDVAMGSEWTTEQLRALAISENRRFDLKNKARRIAALGSRMHQF
jgi:hypothetical protein